MKNKSSEAGVTRLLDQNCFWRVSKSKAGKRETVYPRLRLENGVFVILTSPASAVLFK